MKTTTLTLMIFAMTIALTDTRAQTDTQGVRPLAADLVMKYYRPASVDASSIAAAAYGIYGRSHTVQEDGGSRKVRNLQQVGSSILVVESPAKIEAVLQGLAEMEKAYVGKAAPNMRLENFEYTPRFVSLDDLNSALHSHIHKIFVNTTSGPTRVVNISFVRGRNLMVVRDSESAIAKIRKILERIDVPKQQVTITCYLIEGKSEQVESALPKELTGNLANLTPYKGFDLVTMGMIRTTANANRPVDLSMSGGKTMSCDMTMSTLAWDPRSKTLSIEQLTFKATSLTQAGVEAGGAGRMERTVQSFSTSTTLPANEYTVLGAFGSRPFFVVLKLTPTAG